MLNNKKNSTKILVKVFEAKPQKAWARIKKLDYASCLNLLTTKSLSKDNKNEAALGPCF